MYIVKFLDNTGANPLGTEWNRIIRLKTIKGVKNRVRNSFVPKNAVSYSIYKDIGHGAVNEFFCQNVTI